MSDAFRIVAGCVTIGAAVACFLLTIHGTLRSLNALGIRSDIPDIRTVFFGGILGGALFIGLSVIILRGVAS